MWDMNVLYSDTTADNDVVGVGPGLCYVYMHNPTSTTQGGSLTDGGSQVGTPGSLAPLQIAAYYGACTYLDERIEPCGSSCDVCRGAGIETLVVHAAPGRRGSRVGGDAATAGAFAAAFEEAPVDAELFERLRVTRKRLADAEGVPAYIIFSDAVLRAMAARVPKSEAELLAIPGIGPVKLARYGASFLETLREG